MKFPRLVLVILVSTFWLGCGGSDEPGVAPAIQSLSFDPNTVEAGKQSTISGTLQFEDPDADAAAFALKLTVPGGQSQEIPPSNAQGVSGQTAGTLMFAFIVNAILEGEYDFEIWMIDSAGNSSNRLSGKLSAQ